MTNNTQNITATPENERDEWRTPPELFEALDREFDFDVDVCTNAHYTKELIGVVINRGNSLCEFHMSTEIWDSLERDWILHPQENCGFNFKSYFMNPPFSHAGIFLAKAEEQAKRHNITVVALMNANTDVGWFAQAAKTSSEIRLLTGRVQFLNPDGEKVKNGNPKGQCLIIWRGNCKAPCNIHMVNYKELVK